MGYQPLEHNTPFIAELLDQCRRKANDIAVLFIANRRRHIQPTEQNVRLKLLERASSDEKIDLHIRRLQDFGVKVYLFEHDQAFVQRLMCEGKDSIPEKIRIVYQNGLSVSGIQSRCFISTFCEQSGIPIMNSPSSARAIVWNKFNYSMMLDAAGVPVPQTWLFDPVKGWVGGRCPEPGQLVISKSNHEALALGVEEASMFSYEPGMDRRLLEQSTSLDQSIAVQEFIPGEEVYVTVLEADRVLVAKPVVLEVNGRKIDDFGFLTYSNNRGSEALRFINFTPSQPAITKRIMDVAARAFEIIGLSGLGRLDFRLTKTGKFYLFDAAEVPSLSDYHATSTSLVASGIDVADVIPVVLACNMKMKHLI
jgi:D-alanine-D-alanine ligase